MFWIPILTLLAAMASLSCHRSGPGTHVSLLEDHLASRLLERQVENEDGQELGSLQDLWLNLARGRAEFCVLASDGFLGIGKRLKIVPSLALSTRTTKKYVLALDITRPGWEEAPTLKTRAALALNDPALAKTIQHYYQIARNESDAILPPASEPPGQSAPTPTGYGPTEPSSDPPHSLTSVRELIGAAVVNRHQQRIGRIVDFLVDLSGQRSSYAIVSSDPLLKPRTRFAVPLQLLNQAKGRTFVIDANRSMFDQAQLFDPSIWQNNRIELGKILRFSEDGTSHIANPAQPGSILTAL